MTICLKMPQGIRTCKQIRPWFNKSGLKILSLKSEVLWPWVQIDSWYTHAWAQISSKHRDRLTLHQQPLPWTGCYLLVCSWLNLRWARGPIWEKRDRVPEPKLGQVSTAGCSSSAWVCLCWAQSPSLAAAGRRQAATWATCPGSSAGEGSVGCLWNQRRKFLPHSSLFLFP